MTIRNLPDNVKRALQVRAKAKGVSSEAEARTILQEAVLPEKRLKLGDALVEFGRKYGPLPYVKDTTPYEPRVIFDEPEA